MSPPIQGQRSEAVLDAGQPVQGVLRLQREVHHLPTAPPLQALRPDLLQPLLQPGDPWKVHGLHRSAVRRQIAQIGDEMHDTRHVWD